MKRNTAGPGAILLGLFFLLVVFDGALRKWVVREEADLLFVLKDVILLGALLVLTFRGGLRWSPAVARTALPLVLGAYVAWVAVQVLNPAVPNVTVGLFGARSHLLYMGLLFLVPAWLAAAPHWERLVKRYVLWVVVPVLLLGTYQFFQPATHWVNQYVDPDQVSAGVVAVLGRPRITGTFSYIAGMVAFTTFNACVGYGLLFAGLRGARSLAWWGVAMLVALAAVAPMTGSRGAVLFPLIPFPVVVLVGMIRHGVTFRLGGVLLLVCAGIYAGYRTELAGGWEGVVERATRVDDELSRAERALIGPIERAKIAGWLGYGTGSAHQAAPRLVPGASAHHWLPTEDFEGEAERVALELGWIGLFLYLAFKAVMLGLAFLVFWRAVGPLELFVGASSFSYFVAQSIGQIIYSSTGGAFYWLLGGAVLAVWGRQRVRRTMLPLARTTPAMPPQHA